METTHGKTNQALTDTEIKAAKLKDTDYQLYDGRKTGNFSLDWHCLQGKVRMTRYERLFIWQSRMHQKNGVCRSRIGDWR
ncbi:hypothetical protein FJO73_13765 [Salmonella enterica]|nr:hypothetical protein [Salmonella enterica]